MAKKTSGKTEGKAHKKTAAYLRRARRRKRKAGPEVGVQCEKSLTVTDGAKQRLKELLLANSDDPSLGLRLAAASGQCGLLLDQGAPGDYVIEHEGLKVLLVEPELAALLAGATLAIEDTPQGSKVVLTK